MPLKFKYPDHVQTSDERRSFVGDLFGKLPEGPHASFATEFDSEDEFTVVVERSGLRNDIDAVLSKNGVSVS